MLRSASARAPSDPTAGPHAGPGDFPFRLSDGADESRYLTWLRNHSNYMAVRGLLDYFRSISVLMRGAFVNLLVGLPYLLVLAVAVAAWRVSLDLPPFYVTVGLALFAAPLFVLFPTQTFLTKIRRYRRGVETGTESTVKERDALERRAGKVLAILVAVASFETLPLLLDPFHAWAVTNSFGMPQVTAVMGALLTAFSFADRLLSWLPGALAKIMVSIALGALGVLVPVLIVLFVADFLVFTPPPEAGDEWMTIAAWSLPALIFVGLTIGLMSRAYSRRDVLVLCVALIGSVGVALLTFIPSDAYVDDYAAANTALEGAEEATETDQVLRIRDDELRALTKDLAARPGPRLEALREEIHVASQGLSDELQALHEAIVHGRPVPAPPPSRSVREQLIDDLEYLADTSSSYGIDGLGASAMAARSHVQKSGADADLTELGRAVAHLRRRVALLGNLFVFEGPALVAHVLELSSSDLELIHGPAPSRELASLERFRDASHAQLGPISGEDYYRVVFHLIDWSELLEDARREIAASAVYSPSYPTLFELAAPARETALRAKSTLLLTLALLLWGFCWLTVDVNLTSIHGLYRDRLASAFLVGIDTKGDVDIEDDLDLGDLSRHEAGSTAPYHLINVTLNLQGSRDIGLRDRRSDFFIFSKRFIGGMRTGYCRSETMERVFPQMSLATAMAISAAAAAPNMGRATSPALVALMTFLNIRLGIWVPNPGLLAKELEGPSRDRDTAKAGTGTTFEHVFAEELEEVKRRWHRLGTVDRRLAQEWAPTVQHGLVGLAFSGGGIRSATINLGLAQALDRRGVFRHFDYMSTVSGGGYLGSSLSALMRGTRTVAEISGRASVQDLGDETVVRITKEPVQGSLASLRRSRQARKPEASDTREYRYAKGAELLIEDGARVQAGQRLLATRVARGEGPSSFGEQFRWQVPPKALLWEMTSALDERKRWVNLSDGGHIENLATIELLRRRCKYIVIGDGEADPEHRFNGLATLIRTARIDLGIHIDMHADALRLGEHGRSKNHWAIGRIRYPGEEAPGYLLYLKSSLTGDEDEVIREYRHGHSAFPHESTADQMFDEGQFEAYRSLGQHIGEAALEHLSCELPSAPSAPSAKGASYADLQAWFVRLHAVQHPAAASDELRTAESGPVPRAAHA